MHKSVKLLRTLVQWKHWLMHKCTWEMLTVIDALSSCWTPDVDMIGYKTIQCCMPHVSLWRVNGAISCNYQKLTKCEILNLF